MTFSGRWTLAPARACIAQHIPSETSRAISRPAGTAVLIGHCLATIDQLDAFVDTLLQTKGIEYAGGWPGCYSIVLIAADRVTLLADPVGQFPLFVTTEGESIWFGSRATDIARRTGAALDPAALMVTLICLESWDLTRGRTMFAGIRQLPAGHALSIGPAGILESDHSAIRTDPRATLADSAERLRLALSEAVNARAERAERLTSDLSGGLDSTSLAFLATPGRAELPVLSSHNPNAPVDDDLRRTHRYLRAAAGLRQHVIPLLPEHLPYQVIGPLADTPHGASVAMGGLRSRLACAAELGADVHLVGEGGDLLLGAPPAYLADLARRGEFRRLWRDCTAWARIRGRAPLSLFRRALLVGATPRGKALRALAAALEGDEPGREPTWEANAIGYWPSPYGHWLTRGARRRLAAHIRDTADHLPDDDLGAGDVVTLGQLRQQALTQQVVRDTGTELGIDVHAPFLDTEVVRACLALSASRRADPTEPKPLLRAALTGLVPDAVLSRRTKGDYTRDAYQGVRRAAPTLRRMLAESVAADHGLIEPRPVRDALEGAISGLPTPWGVLNQVFAVETWLRDYEQGGAA